MRASMVRRVQLLPTDTNGFPAPRRVWVALTIVCLSALAVRVGAQASPAGFEVSIPSLGVLYRNTPFIVQGQAFGVRGLASWSSRVGGSRQGQALAMAHAWREAIKFLRRHLTDATP